MNRDSKTITNSKSIEKEIPDDFDILTYRDKFWKNNENRKLFEESFKLIERDSMKSQNEGILSLEEDFEIFHHGFYGQGLRRVIDGCFDYDLLTEIIEEPEKDIQFLNYFYYTAWNIIRYGGDIYKNLSKFQKN